MQIDFEKGDGLVPAIVQDAETFQVLMLGYMNAEALQKTENEGRVTFYSRSKQRLWTKGESSGNFLTVRKILSDCDNDTVLILASPAGPTCHEGTRSCFAQDHISDMRFLGVLAEIIRAKSVSGDNESSYTARLLNDGVKRIAQKVGEEGLEVALAAVSGDDEELALEGADLIYHLLVLLHARGLSFDSIAAVLAKRHLVSVSDVGR
ncbi:MAG: bifunctional phosphoribosyl-AMP cyclohydrolase/phosphoribosyl-ATP diphosphatase HisIE [Bdellovibrionales bacterium]|nr:bifunctional phosphoribosyl-AMP cyclohydrolase/phosphoribosyl-ATP diphosphatase HisIE [Bdellovibrionales bacterium]